MLGRLRLLAVLLLVAAGAAGAEERRVALVIGNDRYAHVPRLEKARNDANAVAAALRRVGFAEAAVETVLDGDRAAMAHALARLVERARGAELAFVFYAGHGVELDGANYLLPVDVPRPTISPAGETLLKGQAIAFDFLLRELAAAGPATTLVVLDACRENPFVDARGRTVGGRGGIADVQVPEGLFVVYSAGARQLALDRLAEGDPDPNSVFTRVFLKHLVTPGLSIRDIVLKTRPEVRELARRSAGGPHPQFPAYYDQLERDLVLLPAPPRPEAAPPALAVRPFAHAPGAARLDRLAGRLAGEVAAGLSRSPGLAVVTDDAGPTGHRPEVRYVLEGRLRERGGRLLVDARLVDAVSGEPLWTLQLERPLGELEAVREALTARIVAALLPGPPQPPPDATLAARDLVALGVRDYHATGRAANARARARLEQAIALAPDFAPAWRLLGWAWEQQGTFFEADPRAAWARSREACARAVALEPGNAAGRRCLAVHAMNTGAFDEARRGFHEALELEPEQADNLAGLSGALARLGEPELGVRLIEQAFRLDPYPTPSYYQNGSNAYFFARDFARCVELRRRLRRAEVPNDLRVIARCEAMRGRDAEARAAAAAATQADGGYSLEKELARTPPPPGPRERDLYLEATRKAGLRMCLTEAELAGLRARRPDLATLPECDALRAAAKKG